MANSFLLYLLLVTFYTSQIADFSIGMINKINASPYNGVAVPLIDIYDTRRHDHSEFTPAIEFLKSKAQKDIWPWIFFNRFVGYAEGHKSHSIRSRSPYFMKIQGMDIYNQAGALKDFLNIWRIALRMARELNSPGIVVDPETYNNYSTEKVAYLAKRLEKPVQSIRERLMSLGARLIDIAENEYPGATIWFLMTGLTRKHRCIGASKEYYLFNRSFTYIIKGMLMRLQQRESKLKIIAGGEISLGYCYRSWDDLKMRIEARNKNYSTLLLKYTNLHLAGTIAPWFSRDLKKSWMLKADCGESTLRSADDFKPLFTTLFRTYPYVWIYGAWAAAYNPYDSTSSEELNKAIIESLNVPKGDS